jgi:hypothetical protein
VVIVKFLTRTGVDVIVKFLTIKLPPFIVSRLENFCNTGILHKGLPGFLCRVLKFKV